VYDNHVDVVNYIKRVTSLVPLCDYSWGLVVYTWEMEISKLERLLKPVLVPLKVKEDCRLALMKHPDFRHVDDVELYHQAKRLAPSVLVTDRASAIAVILSNRNL
jgi:hypothetical protein